MNSDSDSSPSDTDVMLVQPKIGGANLKARELSRRRTNIKVLQTPTTPVTPIVPSTPIIAAHFYAGENVMEDLQLAAELGKTLLERNRELESNIKHQQATIEDQTQEIEYLSKQTAALREVNDSRLRIYEQLEISIHDLEKNNQRITAEGIADKKKIKGLSATIEQLEVKVADVQKSLDEAKAGQQKAQQRGRTHKRRSSLLNEEQLARRSQSCENTTQTSDSVSAEEKELQEKVEFLERQLKEAQRQRQIEVRRREELEIDMSCLLQENSVLVQQLSILREKEVNLRSLDEELASLDETSSSRVCTKCLGMTDETESNNTMQDFTDDIVDFETSFENIHGECALIKLKNGGYAWGSQESLASLGQIMNGVMHCGDSPSTELSDAPHNSLLSELDTQYRILIEKYESLIEVREQQQIENQQRLEAAQVQTIVDSGIDEVSGPMSIVLTNGAPRISGHDATITPLKCQRCTTCSCDLKPSDSRPKSNNEEFSEVETTSSGFSEGESRLYSRGTQTNDQEVEGCVNIITPTPTEMAKCLDIASPMDPFENRFQTTPEYKKLFHEIFTVLKKTVDENELNGVHERIMDSLKNSMNGEDFIESLSKRRNSKENIMAEFMASDENDENKNPNVELDVKLSGRKNDKKKKKEPSKNTPKKTGEQTSQNETEKSKDDDLLEKPKRPDTLAIGDLSRSSSRQSRRRRRNKEHNKIKEDCELPNEQSSKPAVQSVPSNATTSAIQKQEGFATPPSKLNLQNTLNHRETSKGEDAISNPPRCEHKQRKHKNKRHRHLQLLQEKPQEHSHNLPLMTQFYDPQSLWNRNSYQNARPKISHPSVEVAKLRKLEMSYAEVLKSTFNRTQHDRRY